MNKAQSFKCGHPWTPANTYVRTPTGYKDCRTCKAAGSRQWKRNNREKIRAADKGRRRNGNPERWKALVNAGRARRWERLYGGKRCVDCGNAGGKTRQTRLEYDHVPKRGVKLFNIGRHLSRTWKAVQAELRKCDLVCWPCHVKRGRTRRRAA